MDTIGISWDIANHIVSHSFHIKSHDIPIANPSAGSLVLGLTIYTFRSLVGQRSGPLWFNGLVFLGKSTGNWKPSIFP